MAGVEFNTSGGYGSVPGQVVMTNTGSNRNVYIGSNNNNWQELSQFGMEAGTTYDVSYYMNRISGSDLGANSIRILCVGHSTRFLYHQIQL